MEDRSELFNQLKNFSQRKLKKVETKVVTGTGEQLVEKRGAKGLQVLSADGSSTGAAQEQPARKLDLQVGFILPGLLIGSQDVAHDKSSLDSYGITHILNLDAEVDNKFEDDYNYKNVAIQDEANFVLEKIFDECFDFIDDGRHYGNVFVHCSGTIGLSRSTAICVAYLMNKEKQAFTEAFNNVKEARSFVKPNDGFQRQLKEYEVKLRGAQKAKDSGIDDPFALRKKQEIEQEKAMVAGAASVKNRMKMFGAQLDAADTATPRSKSASPAPYANRATMVANEQPTRASGGGGASKWSERQQQETTKPTLASKSMTPEPRTRSWQTAPPEKPSSQMPPPPPPMPTSSLHANDKWAKSGNKSTAQPPPAPPPPPADLFSKEKKSSPASSGKSKSSPHSMTSDRKTSISSTDSGEKMVFGKRPPPQMKIRGGLSIERQDSTSDKILGHTPASSRSTQSLVFEPGNRGVSCTIGGGGDAGRSDDEQTRTRAASLNQRCATPLVLTNNIQPQFPNRPASCRTPSPGSPQQRSYAQQLQPAASLSQAADGEAPQENPFEYWQRTLERKQLEHGQQQAAQASNGQTPKRTVSLGPRRGVQLGEALKKSPFVSGAAQSGRKQVTTSFNQAARELQSSLTELNKLIDETTPSVGARPPPFMRLQQVPTIAKQNRQEDEEEQVAQRWQWQEDLSNWKSSNSVNDLRSAFEVAPRQQQAPAIINNNNNNNSLRVNLPVKPGDVSAGGTSLPPRSASPSVLRQKFELVAQQNKAAGQQQKTAANDYAIRRTTSVSSGSLSSASSASSSIKHHHHRPPPVLRNPYRSQY